MEIEVVHSEVLSEEMPSYWRTFWRQYLSRQAIKVYETLRELDGKCIDHERLAEYLSMSRTRLITALRELERHAFVDIIDEG